MSGREKVILVDKQDNVIGAKWRDELTDTDCWRISCIWITNSKGEALLQKRSMSKSVDPGLWIAGASGTVEWGDDYAQTALKEAEEEIGLSGHKITPTNKVLYRSSFGWRQCQGFTTVCDWSIEKFVIQKEEVSQIEWANLSQLIKEFLGKEKPSRKYPKSLAKLYLEMFNLV